MPDHNVIVNNHKCLNIFRHRVAGGEGPPAGDVFVKLAAKCIDYCVF